MSTAGGRDSEIVDQNGERGLDDYGWIRGMPSMLGEY